MTIERFGCGLQVKFDAGDKAGTFSGYGAVFGNVDSYGDVIERGAFRQTLKDAKKAGRMPKMLLQHGGFFGPSEDAIPVGVWTSMEEDDTGLLVKGELFAMDTQKGRYIHEGLKSGALDGLSIGYIAREVAFGKKPDEPARTLKKIDLIEVSIVTFPANPDARVDSAKSIEALASPAEFERYLRDAGKFSRSQATAFVAACMKVAKRPGDQEGAQMVDLRAFARELGRP